MSDAAAAAASTDRVAQTCQFLGRTYGVRPNESWGALNDLDLRAFWDKHGCNALFKPQDGGAAPATSTHASAALTRVQSRCYIDGWSPPQNLAMLARMDRAILAFWGLDSSGLVTGRNSTLTGVEDALRKLRATGFKIELYAAIGGWGNDATFAAVFGDAARRRTAVNAIGTTLRSIGFQGVDVDWEYPSNQTEANSLVLFCREFKAAFPDLGISIAGSASPNTYVSVGRELASLLDSVHIMTYDFAGSWSRTATVNSGLVDMASSVMAWLAIGFTAKQLFAGSAWYGYRCTARTLISGGSVPGLNQSAWGWDDVTFREITALRRDPAWREVWLTDHATPWLYNMSTEQVITYENPTTVASKIRWARDNALGGVFCWQWNQDNEAGELAQAILGIAPSV